VNYLRSLDRLSEVILKIFIFLIENMRNLKVYKSSFIDRKEDSLYRYLGEISHIQKLSPAEEVMLADRIRKGDKVAEHRLVTANLLFVVSCAKKYQKVGLSFSDLVSEGNLGLIRAAQMFDDTRGFKFITYAVWWVRQAMISALNEHGRMIRLPVKQQLTIVEINQAAGQLQQLLEREPTLEELSEAISKSPERLKDCLLSASRTQYLQDPIPGGETEAHTMLNYLPDQGEDMIQSWIQHQDLNAELEIAISFLSEREQKIIIMAYGLKNQVPMDDESIGYTIGLSTGRIRKLRAEALAKLRKRRKNESLKQYA
jgi:RNA polymerase primary sigma factor